MRVLLRAALIWFALPVASALADVRIDLRTDRTSLSLEQPFFDRLVAIAAGRNIPLATLIAEVDGSRPRDANLSSALRVHVLEWLKSQRSTLLPDET